MKSRHEYQQNRTEDPERNPHRYDHLFLTNEPKTYTEKRQLLQQMMIVKLVIFFYYE
jgi:hypothetical protein